MHIIHFHCKEQHRALSRTYGRRCRRRVRVPTPSAEVVYVKRRRFCARVIQRPSGVFVRRVVTAFAVVGYTVDMEGGVCVLHPGYRQDIRNIAS